MGTAIATCQDFRLVQYAGDISPEIMEEIQDELSFLGTDIGLDCRKIKVPTSGDLAFKVQGDDDGEVDYRKSIDAVVVFTHQINGRWSGSFGDGGDTLGKVPVCSSMDGQTGVCSETGEVISCSTCPFNAYGSAVGQDGRQSRGKACKNMMRLYLRLSDDPNTYLLTVPPTSVRQVNQQLKKILSTGLPCTSMVINLTLERAQNSGGAEYSRVVLRKVGALPPAAAKAAMQARKIIREQYMQAAITADDYMSAPPPAPAIQAAPVQAQAPQPAPRTAPQAAGARAEVAGPAPAGPVFEDAPPLDYEDPFEAGLPF